MPLLRLRSDEQLVSSFRAGNEEAFQVIYDRYRQRIFSYARQMLAGSRSDAEDAMQDVFLRAYNALRADERPLTLKAWLYRVAHNRCIDQLRRLTPAPEDLFEVARTPLRDPIVETERRASLQQLVGDVRRLPEQQRSALLMREIDGLSYGEMAAALSVSVPAVKSLLVRARIGLVEAIEAREADCGAIREDLVAAHTKGVRMSGRARRHTRECSACRGYRSSIRELERGLAGLHPPGFLASLLKLVGVGSAGSSAVAAGGAASVGAGAATGCKFAALACTAAVLSGGAELRHVAAPKATPTPKVQTSEPVGAAPTAAPIATFAVQQRAAPKRRAPNRRAAPSGTPATNTERTAPIEAPPSGTEPLPAPAPTVGATAPPVPPLPIEESPLLPPEEVLPPETLPAETPPAAEPLVILSTPDVEPAAP
ncbi:MAG TPA: sigma-70 family RNA polymerase sigma factor [Baekduia sp.]|nr:sigma-70 family RNA polymerase sigma factor [Baekduia sp.]